MCFGAENYVSLQTPSCLFVIKISQQEMAYAALDAKVRQSRFDSDEQLYLVTQTSESELLRSPVNRLHFSEKEPLP